MLLVRAGKLDLNLEFLIMTEEIAAKPLGLRVTMLPGKEVEVFGDAAESLRRQIDEARIAASSLRGTITPNLAPPPPPAASGRRRKDKSGA